MRRFRLAAALLAVSLQFALADGQDPRARALYARFMTPCCWQESLATHRSPTATEMRSEIDRLLAAGQTEDQIIEHYVAQHGKRILVTPRGPEATWLTIMPFAVLLLGGVFVIRYLMRHRATHSEEKPA